MKKIFQINLALMAILFFTSSSQAQFCDVTGNIAIFSNYDGGILRINVDMNIPNLKIGIVSYENDSVIFSGPYVANITKVIYAGYLVSSNVHCGVTSPRLKTINGAPPGTDFVIYTPTANYPNANGNGSIICNTSCTLTNQGGCNTPDQVAEYFFSQFGGRGLLFHFTQYGCWNTTAYNLSSGGNCCITGYSLTTGAITSPICAGATVSVPYTAGTFTSGNVFTAQLSNAAGSFASPTNIGTLTSTTSGTISATIPLNTPSGTTYRIRVIASTPSVTGTDNGANITINAAPTAAVTPPGTAVICGAGNSSLLSSSSSTAGSGTITAQQWIKGGVDISGSTAPTLTVTAAGNYQVRITNSNGCSATSTVTAVSVSNNPTAVVTPNFIPAACVSSTLLSAASSLAGSGTITAYQWSRGGSPIAGGTAATYSVTIPGNYSVVVTNSNGCTSTSSLVAVSFKSPLFPLSQIPAPVAACNGNNGCPSANNGSASVSASGGTSPYSYLWSNGSTSTSISNLSPGTYTVTVTGANGCITSSSYTVVNPPLLDPGATNNSPVCEGDSLKFSGFIAGGTGPYTFAWTGPLGFASNSQNPFVLSATVPNSGTYSLLITDANGCTASITTTGTVNICHTTLNLNLMIEGYYQGSGQMNPAMYNEAVSGANPNQTDTILVELHDQNSPYPVVEAVKTIVITDGSATAIFTAAINGGTYYIAIRHRNAVWTWSKLPVLFTQITNYNFTTANTQAYGNNMTLVDVGPDIYAFYNGDINQDQNIDLIDFPPLDFGINNGLFGYYATDLNGDGNVDLLDFPVLDANINLGIYSVHP